jgi:hypothetical protein
VYLNLVAATRFFSGSFINNPMFLHLALCRAILIGVFDATFFAHFVRAFAVGSTSTSYTILSKSATETTMPPE